MIYFWQLTLLAVLLILWRFTQLNDMVALLQETFCNIVFLFVVFGGLLLYIRWRKLSLTKSLGRGDIYFIAVSSLSFNFEKYTSFFVFGLLFSLILHLLVTSKSKQGTIPLAGNFALFLLLIIGIEHVTEITLPF